MPSKAEVEAPSASQEQLGSGGGPCPLSLRPRRPRGSQGFWQQTGPGGRAWGLCFQSQPLPFFSRAVSGVDADPDLVHLEAQDLGGGKQGGRRSQGPRVLTPRQARPPLSLATGPEQLTSLCYDVA